MSGLERNLSRYDSDAEEAGLEEEARTTALGLFNFAHSYWCSAVALQKNPPKVTHKEAPVDYLYYHAIELYLKSFLRLSGFDLSDLRSLSHNMDKLHNRAIAQGLVDDPENRRVIALIVSNYLPARYLRIGYFEKAHPEALWGVCAVLHREIEPKIHAAFGVIRSHAVPDLEE